jgi:hypothetical protein
MPRKSPTRTRTAPIAAEMVTPELLSEWRWLRANRRRRTTAEWAQRYKQFYADIGISWPDMAGPLEETGAKPSFDIERQPHRYETFLHGRAWRLALLAVETKRSEFMS